MTITPPRAELRAMRDFGPRTTLGELQLARGAVRCDWMLRAKREVGEATLPLIDTTLRTGGRLDSLKAKENGCDANV